MSRKAVELVYSTDPDWCSKCKHLPCVCQARTAAPGAGKQPAFVKLRLEKSGRGGKLVCVLFDLGMGEAQLQELLKVLKTRCGTGGASKEGCLEIQGDHRDRIEQLLAERGLKVKRAGG